MPKATRTPMADAEDSNAAVFLEVAMLRARAASPADAAAEFFACMNAHVQWQFRFMLAVLFVAPTASAAAAWEFSSWPSPPAQTAAIFCVVAAVFAFFGAARSLIGVLAMMKTLAKLQRSGRRVMSEAGTWTVGMPQGVSAPASSASQYSSFLDGACLVLQIVPEMPTAEPLPPIDYGFIADRLTDEWNAAAGKAFGLPLPAVAPVRQPEGGGT